MSFPEPEICQSLPTAKSTKQKPHRVCHTEAFRMGPSLTLPLSSDFRVLVSSRAHVVSHFPHACVLSPLPGIPSPACLPACLPKFYSSSINHLKTLAPLWNLISKRFLLLLHLNAIPLHELSFIIDTRTVSFHLFVISI